jgi:hypothetical protein
MTRKRLIQWGWDEPDTAFLRQHIRDMEESPFDGCVFSVRYGQPSGGGSFTWEFWGRRRFELHNVAEALADLRALHPRRFRDNFLRVNVTPGDLDWFDDFSPVIANARLAAELARAGHARGVLFDVEQYRGAVFEYRAQRSAATKTWDEYARQGRLRGREVMTAFQQGYPDLTMFLTFGYTLPWVLSENGRKPLSETPYGLLAPFLDGMIEAAHGGTRLVDGFELSYGYRHEQSFTGARQLFAADVLPIVGVPHKYRARFQLAFGLWLDYDWRRNGWSVEVTQGNYHSPESFEQTLRSAIRGSDRYVWIYAETPRWWNRPEPGARVPDGYVSALRRARAAYD